MKIIKKASVIRAMGNPPKKIEEFVGLVNSKTKDISIARMKSPAGWEEPGQTPDFDEYSVVLKGTLRLKTKNRIFNLKAGQAIIVSRGTWVKYSTPKGAQYISVCLPAFSTKSANRDSGKVKS
jgi:ethanolamine utilization protein EutQ (cupin superfamily)